MTIVKFQLDTLTCPTCIQKIEKSLSKMNGVNDVKVLFNSSKVKITYQAEQVSETELKAVIEKLGYPVIA